MVLCYYNDKQGGNKQAADTCSLMFNKLTLLPSHRASTMTMLSLLPFILCATLMSFFSP